MNNLKKLLAVVIVVAMMVAVIVPAFAAAPAYSYSAEAQVLNDLGLYKGISDTSFDPDLATALDRETGVVMLLRIFGLEDQALAISDADSVLAKFSDASSIAAWAKNDVAYAVENGLVLGLPDGTFGPAVALNGKAYATLIMRQLGFTPDYANAPAELAEKGGLDPTQAVKFTDKNLVKDDLVGISYGALKATDKDGKKVIDSLVASGVVTEAAATDAGLVTPTATPTPEPVVVAALDVASASALTSKVVEVALNTAATAVDASAITIKDAAGKAVAVTSAELAPYDTASKTVLVTLEADTTVGTLYTLTTGTKSINFGGRAVNTDKPTITKIATNDYNQIEITFSKPVKLDGAVITATAKYGTKAALSTTNFTYDGNSAIVVTTADQTGSTLYALSVSGVVSFDGNTMDADTAQTFVGKAKSTAVQAITAAKTTDYKTVEVQLAVNVDPATALSAASYAITEMYGTKASIAVTAVTAATTDDTDIAGVALTTANVNQYVFLTVGTMKDSTLYKLAIAGVKTLYGVAESTTDADMWKTFVGTAPYTGVFGFATVPAISTSNTSVTVSFARKVDAATAESIANYAITLSYGTKAALAVSKAELQSNGTDVKLTVPQMTGSLYSLTVTNVKDIAGNLVDSTVMPKTFVGLAVAAKITTVTGIVAADGVTLSLTFDVNVGASLTDVSHYFINGGVGYPTKAIADDATVPNAKLVKLTIPKTTDGTVYTVTVKGLENADGVAMDAAGITGTFVGKGNAATLPVAQGIVALSNNKIEVFFDRAVDDSTMSKVWSTTAPFAGLNTGKKAIKFMQTVTLNAAEVVPTGAYKDPANADGVIFVINAASGVGAKVFNTLTVTFDSKYIYPTNSADTVLTVATNDTVGYGPVMTGVVAKDVRNITVYFDQPVTLANPNKMTSFIVGSDTACGLDLVTSDKIILATDGLSANVHFNGNIAQVAANTSKDNQYTLRLPALADIKDTSGMISAKDDNAGTTSALTTFQTIYFGGCTTAVITGIDTNIYGLFTDNRTMTVYFPQGMDATTISTLKGAVVANANIKVVETYTGGAPVDFKPTIVTYDAATMSATCYFGNGAVTDTNTAHANQLFTLTIANAVKDETGNIPVCADDVTHNTPYVTQVATSPTAAAVPKLLSATVDDGRTNITVKFDRNVEFGATANGPTNGVDITYVDAPTITSILSGLTFTATYGDGTTLSAAALAGVTKIVRCADEQSIVITLPKALALSSTGSVTLRAAGGAMAWTGVANDSTTDSTANFGVVTTPLHDFTAPQVVSAVLTNATTLVVTYDEAVNTVKGDYTAGTINAHAVLAPGTAATFTVSDISGSGTNVITLTVAGNVPLVTGDAGTIAIGATVTDAYGNAFVAIAPAVAKF